MGLSNLTSSIRAKPGISLTGLDTVEASIGRFNNIVSNSISLNGVLSIYDSNRNKQLSVGRNLLSFSIPHRNVTSIRWLKHNGAIGSNVSGFKFIRDATIIGITIQTNSVGTGTFEIIERTDTTATNLFSVTLTNEDSKVDDDLNIDVNKNSVIEVKLISGKFSYPTTSIEFAWKF